MCLYTIWVEGDNLVDYVRMVKKKYNIKLKKSLGQNFLSVPKIAEEIVCKSMVTEDDTVIEIGSGIGILTEEIAKRAKRVISFEIDERFKPLLTERLEKLRII